MNIKNTLAVAATCAVLVAACGGDDSATSTEAPPTTQSVASVVPTDAPSTTLPVASVPVDYDGYRQQPTACNSDQPESAVLMEFDGPGDADLGETTVMTLDTSCGPIVIELDSDVAPEAVNSFAFLAESGYFDGTVSHRVIPGFMMQAGDPTATGRGGPGYAIPDEFPSDGTQYSRGIVAMANAGPGTTGSQFFIMFEDVDWLGPQYTIIGEVTSGMETLDLIAAVPLGASPGTADPTPSTPVESVYIVSVSIER